MVCIRMTIQSRALIFLCPTKAAFVFLWHFSLPQGDDRLYLASVSVGPAPALSWYLLSIAIWVIVYQLMIILLR